MKKINAKRMAVLLGLCLVVTAIPGMASAETQNITGIITTAATNLSYTITSTITLTASPETDVLTISDVVIQNTQGVGRIQLHDITVKETKNGWKLDASDTNFKTLPLDSKKFSLIAKNGSMVKDLSNENMIFTDQFIDAKSQETIKFNGCASGSTYEAQEEAIILVATISGEKANRLFEFKISGIDYTAEEGMTWGEWAASEYSKSLYVIDGGYIKLKEQQTKGIYDSEMSTFNVKDHVIKSNGTYSTTSIS